jgi:GNAT superfamily N-acetyltransferase
VAQEISIRRAVEGDQAILAALSAFVQGLHVRERSDVFKPVDPTGLEQWFVEALATGTARIWIASLGETPVGYALVVELRRGDNVFTYPRRWHEVEQIGVHPDYMRRGIARALFRRIGEAAMADGVSEIELNTWIFNKVAHLSFERLGFAPKNLRFVRQIKPTGWSAVQPADEG